MPTAAELSCLVVDDQSTMRQLVRHGLASLGVRDVEDASNGEDGLRKVITRKTSLVISDFNMPGLDGIDFLRAIRAYPPIATTPFIMLTGRADRELVERAVQCGVNNYLVKPFNVQTLKEKIEAVLGRLT
jgi:two-component system chemotaxis response regulator CheY